MTGFKTTWRPHPGQVDNGTPGRVDTGMTFFDKTVVMTATGFYIGRSPKAPGTLGTLLGIPVCLALASLPLVPAAIALVLFIGASVWVSDRAEKALGAHDPGCIVIDEVAGLAVALIGLPVTPGVLVVGFVLFRIFDILKPPPIRTMERLLKGGWAVVMDDVVAGVIVNGILRLAGLWWPLFTLD